MINAEFNESIDSLIVENLYQWDTYQTLKITGIDFSSITLKVHFANKKSTEALAVQGVLKDDGSCEVSIPNSLLAEKYDIIAYIYINTGLTFKTIKSITIPIIPRLKPTEYIQPSNEEIAEIEKIELQAKIIIDGLTASEYSPTEKYTRPNIVYYNQCGYMCICNTEITGIVPTDTSKWQEIVHGELISSIGVGVDGKLTFTTSSGTNFSIDFQVKNVQLVDETDVPALKITQYDVSRLKSITKSNIRILQNIKITTRPSYKENNYTMVTLTSNGLYLIEYRLLASNPIKKYYQKLIFKDIWIQDSSIDDGIDIYNDLENGVIKVRANDSKVSLVRVCQLMEL